MLTILRWPSTSPMEFRNRIMPLDRHGLGLGLGGTIFDGQELALSSFGGFFTYVLTATARIQPLPTP